MEIVMNKRAAGIVYLYQAEVEDNERKRQLMTVKKQQKIEEEPQQNPN